MNNLNHLACGDAKSRSYFDKVRRRDARLKQAQLKAKASQVNAIIHHRNLYAVVEVTGALDRVVNARVFECGDGVTRVAVDSLNTGHIYLIPGTNFKDGNGQEVVL